MGRKPTGKLRFRDPATKRFVWLHPSEKVPANLERVIVRRSRAMVARPVPQPRSSAGEMELCTLRIEIRVTMVRTS